MIKKILLGLVAVAVVAGGVAAMSAWEAHVINVTAKIENALTVTPEEIAFGTVFPQEIFFEDLDICLSNSFIAEDRADNVNYVIRQKPKPRTEPDRDLPVLKPDYNMYKPGGPFAGQLYPHWIDDDYERMVYCHTHQPADPGDPMDLYYINCFPVLCPWLSKEKADDDITFATDQCKDPDPASGDPYYDCGVSARHEMGATAYGHLVKSVDDDCDHWVIDFDVPCFEGMCAQDWTYFGWELPAGLEEEEFGCDLWIEVTGVSINTAECGDDIDNDGDGLIDFDGNGVPALADPDCESAYDTSESS